MPSTYSPELRIELIANGEQSGTWGSTTNSNLGTLIEAAIASVAAVSVTSASQALTALNGAADQSRNAVIDLTTTTTANFAVYIPPSSKLYIIRNSSAYAATIYCSTVLGNTTAAGVGVVIPASKVCMVWTAGANVIEQLNHIIGAFSTTGAVAVGGALAVTGAATIGGTLAVTGASAFTGIPTGPTAVVATNTTQFATTAFVRSIIPAGVILMWSGSIASVPSGWLLCDGTNSTPDLRNRFIVGAGSTYAVNDIGGAADAIVVSHTHTATVTDPGHFHISGGISDTSAYGTAAVSGNGKTGSAAYNTSPITNTKTTGVTVANSTAGASGTNANLPPYLALAYIMKS